MLIGVCVNQRQLVGAFCEKLQMEDDDTVRTRISKVSPATRSHLSNMLEFRDASDVKT